MSSNLTWMLRRFSGLRCCTFLRFLIVMVGCLGLLRVLDVCCEGVSFGVCGHRCALMLWLLQMQRCHCCCRHRAASYQGHRSQFFLRESNHSMMLLAL
jgi:hypothetical protein